jgi:RNA 3'-terminal phosphate cyclase
LKIVNIRSGRPKPGLAAQHLEGILLLSELSNGKIENGFIGSTNISYIPSNRSLLSKYVANPNTAGSITLMIQISLPAIVLSIKNNEKTLLELHGGTNVSTSPSIDHVYHILLPLLHRHFCINASLELKQRGYYPKGGGLIKLEIQSCNSNLTSLDLVNRGKVKSIYGSIFGNVNLDKKKEFEIEINSKIRTLLSNRSSQLDKFEDIDIKIDIVSENSMEEHHDKDNVVNNSIETQNTNNSRGICFQWKKGQCNRGDSCKFSHSMNNNNQNFKRKEKLTIGAIIWGVTDTGCYLFADDLVTDINPVLDINKLLSTFTELLDSGACCDEKTTDQLIIYMAVSIMKSDDENKVFSILCEPINRHSSLHLETSINVASHFTNVRFNITEQENKCRLVQCFKS